MAGAAPDGSTILSVAELTHEMRGVLGTTFGDVWVRGEISQPRTPASGHVYLTLKDAAAVLPAVIWRTTAARLRFRPVEGQESRGVTFDRRCLGDRTDGELVVVVVDVHRRFRSPCPP